METPKYIMLEHTSDAFWEAYGEDLAELMSNSAMALMDTIVNVRTVNPRVSDRIEVRGTDLENLLYNWLDALIALISINARVYSRFETLVLRSASGEYDLKAEVWGEPIDHKRHQYRTEVKGVTYHLMSVEKQDGGWKARFILDL